VTYRAREHLEAAAVAGKFCRMRQWHQINAQNIKRWRIAKSMLK
jgi:hypothetical protein